MSGDGSGKKFSSRVLNMKFMRKAEEVQVQEDEEVQSKKLRDLSEWKLPNLTKEVKAKLVNRPKIAKVGFSSLLQEDGALETPLTGRKKYGEIAETDTEAEVDDTHRKETKSEKESKEFMNNLWKQQKKEDDSILDSLRDGISGAGSSQKRKPEQGSAGGSKGKKHRTR